MNAFIIYIGCLLSLGGMLTFDKSTAASKISKIVIEFKEIQNFLVPLVSPCSLKFTINKGALVTISSKQI